MENVLVHLAPQVQSVHQHRISFCPAVPFRPARPYNYSRIYVSYCRIYFFSLVLSHLFAWVTAAKFMTLDKNIHTVGLTGSRALRWAPVEESRDYFLNNG